MTIDEKAVEAIFVAALDKNPQERSAFVADLCASNLCLLQRVCELLSCHDENRGPLDAPPIELKGSIAEDLPDPPLSERPGAMIGPYKLIGLIGQGGMGAVWLAEQSAPVKRQVAIKFIRAGMDSKHVVARFEAERQTLAMMDHPNIARVLDAGATGEKGGDNVQASNDGGIRSGKRAGVPYFVMDLVDGAPITRYCDENALTLRQRLVLFLSVCHAVQHAHQKGVIHRDIKPSNVLVGLYDGKPVPKVIDFGVAKAIGSHLTHQTLDTAIGSIIGTLEYMAPEQADVKRIDADTRSDVYSLGVLLYELLTGSTPFSRKELEQSGMLEMLRVIREQDPDKPSAKLTTTAGLAELAANRRVEPGKLTKLVRGELDWIVMKALEKDRGRRYESPNALADDVQRFLTQMPVLAGPPTPWYRIQKFVRRHAFAVMAASVVLATVFASASTLTWGVWKYTVDLEAAKEAAEGHHREAVRQRQVAIDNLRAVIADIQDLENLRPELDDLRQDLLVRTQRYLSILLADPDHSAVADEAEFWLEIHIGDVCRDQDHELPSAREHYQRAKNIAHRIPAEGDFERMHRRMLSFALSRLADIQVMDGQPHRAMIDYLEMFAQRKLIHAAEADRVAKADLAVANLKVGDCYRQLSSVGGYQRLPSEVVPPAACLDLVEKHYNCCHALYAELTTDYPESIEYARMYGHAWDRLADLRTERGEWNEVIEICKKALAFRAEARRRFPKCELAFDLERSYTLDRLNVAYMHTKKFAQARVGAEETLPVRIELAQRNPRNVWFRQILTTSYHQLGQALAGEGRRAEARESYQKSLAIIKALSDAAPQSNGFQTKFLTIQRELNQLVAGKSPPVSLQLAP